MMARDPVTPASRPPPQPPPWPPGGTEAARLIRAHDWAATPLGPIEAWPGSLKAVVDLLLPSGFPMIALWGPDLVQIYNDGYRALMGLKHPAGLGQPTRECWPEVWHINEPIYARIRGGETVAFEDALYPITRHGALEDAWFTLSYSPLRDEAGLIAGVLVTVFETTERVLAERRRSEALSDLTRSEARLRALVAAGADAVYRMSPDWRRMDRLKGLDVLADTAQPSEAWADVYILPEDRPAVFAAIAEAIEGKQLFELEHRVRRADGSVGWTLSRAVPVLGPDGDIVEWFGAASDVTARREMVERLRENEELFRSFADNSADALWIVDAETGRLQYLSPAFEAIWGESRERLLADLGRWAELVHPDDRADASSGLPKLLAGIPYSQEYRIVRPSDGAVRWIQDDGFPIRDEAGRVRRFAGIAQDVTARRAMEDALRGSEERFRRFGEETPDVLWIRDAEDLRFDYVSPSFETVYGESVESVLDGDSLEHWLRIIVPEDARKAVALIDRARAGERVTQEFRIRRPNDGQVRIIRDTSFPIRDGAGIVRRIGGIGHDVTEVRRASERLRRSERRQRALVEGIPQLVWRAVDCGHWTWASPQWTAYTGQSEETSRGIGWLDPLHPDDRDAAMTAWREAQGTGAFHAEHRICHAPGERYRWFQTRATPLRDDDGRVTEWLGTSTDIDDLRGLHERQRLLVGELQHRVRNTLGVIRSIARRTARSSDNVEAYATHLDGRLNAFARVQAAVTRDPTAGVDLAQLVADELAAWAAHEGKAVSVHGPPVRLQAKAAETLALALHELATNAVKHGALGTSEGHVAATWRVEAEGDKQRFVFVWKETGLIEPPMEGRRGFGTELIERTLAYELDAGVTRAFEPDGLRCVIVLDLDDRIVIAGASSETERSFAIDG